MVRLLTDNCPRSEGSSDCWSFVRFQYRAAQVFETLTEFLMRTCVVRAYSAQQSSHCITAHWGGGHVTRQLG